MAKAVAKSKKAAAKAAAKSTAKSKSSAGPKAGAAATSARKAVKTLPPKPAPKPVAKPAAKKAPARKPQPEAAKAGKWVYTFGDGKAEGKAGLRDLLGGKGANLAEMANLGLPVPPGFTIPTSVCTYFYAHDKTYPAALKAQVEKALDYVGRLTGKAFGDARNPLLVSVRSGARASMPGMMDTVLNLGLNDKTVEALAELSGDKRFAYDSYRRFITMYSDVVLGFEHHHFEDILDTFKDGQGYTLDTDLSGDDWVELVGKYKEAVARETGKDFPQDPHEQLWGAIGAVFSSWMNARAVTYRKLHDIPESWGTAVNVQAMVFGNMGETSATGVAFTRNPSTGESKLYGEFLINAQGEDVVAGIRTPQDITEEARQESGSDKASMESAMPDAFKELTRIYTMLEKHYRDMQDMEFTVEQGKLWMLQTRGGKRTAKAALRIAVELADEGLISKKDAVMRIDPASLDQLLHPTIDPQAKRDVIATGLPASPGAASGEIVFSSDEAAKLQADGRAVILVRIETSPEDIHGMHAAEGILTTRGGMTSHAAVVARGMGKPCVSGCGAIRVDYGRGTMSIGSRTFKTGDVITIDGSLGQVLAGRMPMIEPKLSGEFGTLMGWADEVRKLGVRVNGDTPDDARTAVKFGAEGIGLCRTEHMFFEETRIRTVREMILSEDEQSRRAARLLVLGKDHLAHGADAGFLEEHVLGAAQTDALGAELDRGAGIVGRIAVDANAELADLVSPAHQRAELARQLRLDHRHAAGQHLAERTVDGDDVAGLEGARADAHGAAAVVDADGAAAGDAGLAHAARHHGGVRGHAAPGGQNAFRGVHAVNVFRAGLDADQDDGAAVGLQLGGFIRRKHDLAGRRTGRRRQAGRDHVALGLGIDGRVQQLIQRSRIDPHHRVLLRDQALIGEFDRDAQRGLGRALAAAGLQHPQLALLDRELHVLHVAVVLLEHRVDARQLLERVRHRAFHRCLVGAGFLARFLGDVLRRADARHHVLALRVDQEFAVELALAGRGIAREGDAGRRRLAHVAEHHRLHVDGGAPGFRNVVQLAIGHRARVHPG